MSASNSNVEELSERCGYNMQGFMVFRSLVDAVRAGYQIVDRTSDGYIVRAKTTAGWALALVREPCRAPIS
jgi:hypothetical protein